MIRQELRPGGAGGELFSWEFLVGVCRRFSRPDQTSKIQTRYQTRPGL